MDEATKKYRDGEKLAKERDRILLRHGVILHGPEVSEILRVLRDAHEEIAWLRETYDERKCFNAARNGITCFYDSEKHGDAGVQVSENWVRSKVFGIKEEQ